MFSMGLLGRALTDYAGVVGQLLAKGHARTSGASMIMFAAPAVN